MSRKTKLIILVILIGAFLFLYPYTKEVKRFNSTDLAWRVLNKPKKTERFDFEHFRFETESDYSREISELSNKYIRITGFIKREKHLGHTHLLLTENVSDVCAFCEHDAHYEAVVLHPSDSSFKRLPDDAYVKVSGTFMYDTARHLPYHIFSAVTDSVFITDNLNR